MTLEYSQPTIPTVKRSCLRPLHHHSALTLHNISSGQQEHVPHVESSPRGPPIPDLAQEHIDDFINLQPGETSVVRVSF